MAKITLYQSKTYSRKLAFFTDFQKKAFLWRFVPQLCPFCGRICPECTHKAPTNDVVSTLITPQFSTDLARGSRSFGIGNGLARLKPIVPIDPRIPFVLFVAKPLRLRLMAGRDARVPPEFLLFVAKRHTHEKHEMHEIRKQ